MPSIKQINDSKKFQKREYRPWNLSGEKQEESLTPKTNLQEDEIITLPTDKIVKWKFKDRPENELGDIKSLADDLVNIGQQQPCIVRPIAAGKEKGLFELIVGERRWQAAKLAGVELRVIIKELSDSQAALIQSTEN